MLSVDVARVAVAARFYLARLTALCVGLAVGAGLMLVVVRLD